jgi:signal transduction histidine kinase
VTDNGKGFDNLRLADPNALGLLGMRERALLLGGTIDIQSRSGAGTVVTLYIPLANAEPGITAPLRSLEPTL